MFWVIFIWGIVRWFFQWSRGKQGRVFFVAGWYSHDSMVNITAYTIPKIWFHFPVFAFFKSGPESRGLFFLRVGVFAPQPESSRKVSQHSGPLEAAGKESTWQGSSREEDLGGATCWVSWKQLEIIYMELSETLDPPMLINDTFEVYLIFEAPTSWIWICWLFSPLHISDLRYSWLSTCWIPSISSF